MALRVSAIIPAYNEADIIGKTIQAVSGISDVSEIMVADDGSTDQTAETARSAGADRVIVLPKNMGKGGALNDAWSLAKGEVLLLLDADLGPSASEAAKLLEPVMSGRADMAIAVLSRSESEQPSSDGLPHLAAKSGGLGLAVKTARLGIKLLTGRRMEAPLAGPRALKREIVERAGGFASRFGVEVGLTIDALRMGYRVVEVPVAMVHRPSGRSLRGFLHRGGQMADILRTLGRKALRR